MEEPYQSCQLGQWFLCPRPGRFVAWMEHRDQLGPNQLRPPVQPAEKTALKA